MFRVGLNPYGLAYTVGLQGVGTARANPNGIGLDGFVTLTRKIGAQGIELDWRWLTPLTYAELDRLSGDLEGLPTVCSCWLDQQPDETLDEPIRCATAVGATVIRLHLTPVLEGARASWGPRWGDMVAHARATLRRESPKAADAGLVLAIENHQDFGSDELLAFAEEAGENVGVVLDTGNPFAVAEDPVEFTRRAAHRIRHVHLKDYRAQFTEDGYRLVRCAFGDGCVPFPQIAAALASHGSFLTGLTASLELGALDARHIRLFGEEWWTDYPPRQARELATALGRLRRNQIDRGADWRTPWERFAPGSTIVDYEMGQMHRSVDNLRSIGWM
jgi:sugar phosphate isomerase/epimerase